MHRFLLVLPALLAMTLQAQQVPSFKVSGTVMAPITIELYTDFQCPHCRAFYLETLPSLNAEFIKTGKVKLIHRDFPLPAFQFSKTAMHYANAAGQIGKYEVVAQQLFESQPEWAQNGNVDAAVAKVLTPAEMEKVRNIIKTDTHLDDSVAKDVALATETDHLTATPTIVFVYKGKREVVTGGMPYPVLKQYLQGLLAQ